VVPVTGLAATNTCAHMPIGWLPRSVTPVAPSAGTPSTWKIVEVLKLTRAGPSENFEGVWRSMVADMEAASSVASAPIARLTCASLRLVRTTTEGATLTELATGSIVSDWSRSKSSSSS
jgi:hypothetical protein